MPPMDFKTVDVSTILSTKTSNPTAARHLNFILTMIAIIGVFGLFLIMMFATYKKLTDQRCLLIQSPRGKWRSINHIDISNLEFSKFRLRSKLTWCDAAGMWVHRDACKAAPEYRAALTDREQAAVMRDRPINPPNYRYEEDPELGVPPPTYISCHKARRELRILRHFGKNRPCRCTRNWSIPLQKKRKAKEDLKLTEDEIRLSIPPAVYQNLQQQLAF